MSAAADVPLKKKRRLKPASEAYLLKYLPPVAIYMELDCAKESFYKWTATVTSVETTADNWVWCQEEVLETAYLKL